jgi:hypothetical protein
MVEAVHRDVIITTKNDARILVVMQVLVKESEEFSDYNQTLNYLLERGYNSFMAETEKDN